MPKVLESGKYVYVEPLLIDMAFGKAVGIAQRRSTADMSASALQSAVSAIASDGRCW